LPFHKIDIVSENAKVMAVPYHKSQQKHKFLTRSWSLHHQAPELFQMPLSLKNILGKVENY
jgi:hypothetical protein